MKQTRFYAVILTIALAFMAIPLSAQAASANFTHYARHLMLGQVNYSTVSLKTLLVSAAPTETQLDTWDYRADVTTEVTGTGYTAGGVAQAFTLDALDTTGNRQTITLTNLTSAWTTATISAVGAIVYANIGTSATDILIGYVDFGGTVSSTAGSYSVTYGGPIYTAR